MTRNPFRSMINIGAVDTHIDPYTHTNEYSSEPQLPCAIPVASQYVTNTRGEIFCIPVDQQLVHYASYQFCSLFLFLCSGIAVIKSPCVWPDDDGYRNTERAREYLSNVGGANPNLELSRYFPYFSVN